MEAQNQATRKEHFFYSAFYFGQNVLWGFAGLVSTYLLDIGLDAAIASVILLVPKIWDAVNDTIFGIIVDRTRFKNGQKFLPWVKIGTAAVGIATILMFAIPASLNDPRWKIAWFVVAYILFDAAYTILDAPMFAMPTVMTTSVGERTAFIAGNKLWSMVGAMFATVLIPLVRPRTGWFVASIIFICFAVAFMLPFLFIGKERFGQPEKKKEDEQAEISFREMARYIRGNRYLFVALLVILIMGVSSVESTLTLIMARNCLGNESLATIVSACVAVPVIFVSAVIPAMTKRWDKYNVLIGGLTFSAAMGVVSYFVGYGSIAAAAVCVALKCVGLSFYTVICYIFVADCVEYGTYKSGTRAAGLTFSLQCFVAKLKNAFLHSIALGALALFGYDSSLPENAVQSPEVTQGIWAVFNLLPVIGCVLSILLLVCFYKLRDKDVQVMSLYNNGEISREEAVEKLSARYGLPAEKETA